MMGTARGLAVGGGWIFTGGVSGFGVVKKLPTVASGSSLSRREGLPDFPPDSRRDENSTLSSTPRLHPTVVAIPLPA